MGSWLNLVFVFVIVLKSKALSIVVVQNKGKEMNKKSSLQVKICYVQFRIRKTVAMRQGKVRADKIWAMKRACPRKKGLMHCTGVKLWATDQGDGINVGNIGKMSSPTL